ncbi:hypothetical protein VP01_10714g1, partial [Puccinia sorghi]
ILYTMAQLHPAKKVNSNIITGEMHMIFFRPGIDRGKSAGYQQKKNLIQEYGIPNWSQDEWVEMKKDDWIEYSFASNVSVTYKMVFTTNHIKIRRISLDGNMVFSLTSTNELVNQYLLLPVI